MEEQYTSVFAKGLIWFGAIGNTLPDMLINISLFMVFYKAADRKKIRQERMDIVHNRQLYIPDGGARRAPDRIHSI